MRMCVQTVGDNVHACFIRDDGLMVSCIVEPKDWKLSYPVWVARSVAIVMPNGALIRDPFNVFADDDSDALTVLARVESLIAEFDLDEYEADTVDDDE